MCLYVPTSVSEPVSLSNGCVVALGCFDGLHIGHQALLCRALKEADKRSLPLVVYSPESRKGQAFLTTPAEKQAMLYAFGANKVILADFDAIKDLDADAFVSEILLKQLNCRAAVCGYNFRFGKFAAGDCVCLSNLLRRKGADTVVLPAVQKDGADVSSTRIRTLLQEGKIEAANVLLAEPFSVTGNVTEGRKIGRTLGFPTANLVFAKGKLIPKNGVYYCRVQTAFGLFGAIANVGVRPTFDDRLQIPVLEAHLFCFDQALYGSEIRVSLVSFLRPEMKFSAPEELAATVRHDIEKAKALAANDPMLTKELS